MISHGPAWTNADKPTEALPLFDASRSAPLLDSLPPQERRFRSFHASNPHVLREVIRLALDLKARGISQGAIDLIFEDLRRLHPVETRGDSFRLNNTFRAYYARLAAHREPQLDGYFETRRQRVPFDPKGVIP